MRKVKGISYDVEEDKDVIDHIKKQPNGSKYVIDLVRKDMYKTNDNMKDLIIKYIEEYLKDKEIINKNDSVDISSIDDILKL